MDSLVLVVLLIVSVSLNGYFFWMIKVSLKSFNDAMDKEESIFIVGFTNFLVGLGYSKEDAEEHAKNFMGKLLNENNDE